jgi:hypothetical protein
MPYLKYYITKYNQVNSVESTRSLPEDFFEWLNPKEWRYVPPVRPTMPDGTANFFGGHLERIAECNALTVVKS